MTVSESKPSCRMFRLKGRQQEQRSRAREEEPHSARCWTGHEDTTCSCRTRAGEGRDQHEGMHGVPAP